MNEDTPSINTPVAKTAVEAAIQPVALATREAGVQTEEGGEYQANYVSPFADMSRFGLMASPSERLSRMKSKTWPRRIGFLSFFNFF